MGWSDRFAKHLRKRDISQIDAVVELRSYGVRATQSQVHYWCCGSRPREQDVRNRIERWSDGAIPACAPRESKSA